MVFARDSTEQKLSFGVSGKLIMNALVMYDHQTGSLWSQFLGEAVAGPLKGNMLDLLPAQLTTWSAWSNLHPDTTALSKGGFGSGDNYSSYYRGPSAGILGETNKDARLPAKEFVVGLTDGPFQKAYPFRYLNDTPVLNDSFNGIPVVITFDPLTITAAVFSREIGGQTLTFQPGRENVEGITAMTDLETGSTWLMSSGQAVAGAFAGRQLTQVPSHLSFWFAWNDFYPATDLYLP